MQPVVRKFFLLCALALSPVLDASQCVQKIKQSWHEYKTRVPTRLLAVAVCENDILNTKKALLAEGNPLAPMPDIALEKHRRQTCGESILDHAIEYNYFDIVKALLEVIPTEVLRDNVELLINASENLPLLKLLLKAGIDFNKDSLIYSNTPPMMAVSWKKSQIVQLYYALGVDIMAQVQKKGLEWALSGTLMSRQMLPFVESGLEMYKKRQSEYQKSMKAPIHELLVQNSESYFPKDCSNIIVEYAYGAGDVPITFGNILDDDYEMPVVVTEESKEKE